MITITFITIFLLYHVLVASWKLVISSTGIRTTFHMIHIVTFYHDAKDGVYMVKEKNGNNVMVIMKGALDTL